MAAKSLQKERQEKIALGILMLALLWGGNKYFYKPLGIQLKKANVELSKNYKIYQDMKQKTLSIDIMRKDLEELREVVGKTEQKLPTNKKFPSLLNIVTYRMEINNIRMRSFIPMPVILKDSLIEMPFKIVVTGRFHDLARFFVSLGASKRIIHIKDLDFDVLNDISRKKHTLIAQFTLVVYSYRGMK